VVLKLTFRSFQHVTRRTTLERPTSDGALIAAAARTLLDRSDAASRLVRLVGVGVSGIASEGAVTQLLLPTSDT
jgi:nucleotidyltransferase/DNA polymerase involved in DNA repair